MDDAESNGASEAQTAQLGEQREDSESGTGNSPGQEETGSQEQQPEVKPAEDKLSPKEESRIAAAIALAEKQEQEEAAAAPVAKEENPFPIKLLHPQEPVNVYEHFSKALDAFQKEIYHSKDDTIKPLTITAATLDAPVMPEVHHSPYCGFKLTKGDVFSVRLSNGKTVTAVHE